MTTEIADSIYTQSQNNKPYYLSVALEAAKIGASRIIEARKSNNFTQSKKRDKSILTSVDIAVQKEVLHFIRAAIPDQNHIFLAEEEDIDSNNTDINSATNSDPDSAADFTACGTQSENYNNLNHKNGDIVWVLDPIDGTTNFTMGLPEVAVSLGVIVNNELVSGVVHAPFLDKVYYATKGAGAFCNGAPIKASRATDISEVLIATGFPYLHNRDSWFTRQLKRIEKVGRAAHDIRRNGACSIDLCRVADGTFGGFFETVQPWDIAAGQLICKEAGAKVGYFSKFNSNEHKILWGDFAKKRGLPHNLIQDVTSRELRSDDYFVAAEGIFHQLHRLLSE